MPEIIWVGLAAWLGGLVGASWVLLWHRLRPGEKILQPPTIPPVPLAAAPRLPFTESSPELPAPRSIPLNATLPSPENANSAVTVNNATVNNATVDTATVNDAAVDTTTASPIPTRETVGTTLPTDFPQPPEQDDGREEDNDRPFVLIHQEWNAAAVLRQLESSSPQVQSLYLEMGYSLSDERRCDELLHEIRLQIEAEIPDFESFRKTLKKLTEQAREGSSNTPPALREARQLRLEDPLLRAALAVIDDEDALLQVLNRNPVMEALPFVEQIPIYRDGKVSWRTPVELKILRKRPRDSSQLVDLLSELHRRVRASELRRPIAAKEAVLDAVERVERDLKRPNAYLPTSLRTLLGRVDDWLHKVGSKDDPERRQRLDIFLRQLVEVRHCFENAVDLRLSATRRKQLIEALGSYHRTTLELADHYLRAAWLQRPLLSSWLIHNLLSAELVTVPHDARLDRASPGGVLAMICRETADGHYDGDETMHRLHQLEERGFYVHSLVFALLRLPLGRQQRVR